LRTSLESLELVLSSRQNLFNIISANKSLQKLLRITERSAKSTQVECLVDACKMALRQNLTTDSLSAVTYLSDLVPACKGVGLDVDVAVQEVTADILWAQGEQQTAIRILHALEDRRFESSRSKSKANPAILAKLVRNGNQTNCQTNVHVGPSHRRGET
jgi:ataxia telangiectasia mutated family protein